MIINAVEGRSEPTPTRVDLATDEEDIRPDFVPPLSIRMDKEDYQILYRTGLRTTVVLLLHRYVHDGGGGLLVTPCK
jgi:hypothetical protein